MDMQQYMMKRRPTRHDEERLQMACCRWFGLQYPHLAGCLFHAANGGWRSPTEAARLKAMGVVPGVADLLLIYRGRVHAIELKTPTGRQSPAQKQWQRVCETQGVSYTVVRGIEEFINHIGTIINGAD